MNCGHSCAEVFRMFEGYYGPYFTPSVDADGNLTWTNNAGLPDPAPINIKGEPGTGLEISGLVATEADLPATAEDWTCYLVGTEVPYTVYTYNPNTGWMSLGQLASGPKGDPGAVYTPSVSPEGILSWTNDGGLPNPEPVNIKGPKGDPGGGGGTSDYNDLSNLPQIGGVTLQGNKTPAQLGLVAAQQGAGLIPDTERQQIQDNADDIADLQGKQQQQGSDLQHLQTDVDAIEAKIPNQASAQNQLADKDFVNSSINSSTAFFRGSFASRAALLDVAWQTSDPAAANFVSNNDYAYVQDDESQNDEAWRYIYVLETGGQNNGWQPQFRVNESPLTAAQVAALNSGATAALIAQITANQTAIAGKITAPNAPTLDQFLKWNGTAWVAASLPVNPDAKTTDQTQPVGVDSNGKLWTAPGGGGGSSDVWEPIYLGVLSEDGANKWYVDQDMNGNPFDLSKIIVRCKCVAAADNSAQGYGKIFVNVASDYSPAYTPHRIVNTVGFFRPAGQVSSMAYYGQLIEGDFLLSSLFKGDSDSIDSTGAITSAMSKHAESEMGMVGQFTSSVSSIMVGTDAAAKFGAGSVLAIYGVRA